MDLAVPTGKFNHGELEGDVSAILERGCWRLGPAAVRGSCEIINWDLWPR